MPSEKRVRRRLADGTVKTYTYASTPRADAVWTLGRLIASYRRSAHFAGLAPTTRAAYLRHLEHLRPLADVPIGDIKRRHVRAIRDELAVETPAVANAVAKLARALLAFAVDDDLLDYNVLIGMRALPGGEHRAWTEAQVAAIPLLPENLRRAAILGLYTGQRVSDVAAMTWSAYDGAGIEVTQQKTGARLWIPAHASLRAELDTWTPAAVTILTTYRGTPWRSGRVLSARFAMATGETPALAGVTFHGLRKTAAARLAEAGCSTHEIAAITGHKTLQMIQHYTRDADQKRRATAAIFRLENAGKTERK